MLDEVYMTVKEVARWLNLNPQTIRKMIHEKKLKALRIGDGTKARYRIAMINVLEWSNRSEEKK